MPIRDPTRMYDRYLGEKGEAILQSRESLTHFGVKGMKWGVRKEPEKNSHLPATGLTLKEKAHAKVEASNKKYLTNDTKVRENYDGSLLVSGLKNIKNAKFDSKESYEKWINGETNPFSEREENPIVKLGGKKISDGTPTVVGSGYSITFANDKQYESYSKNTENAKIQMTLSYGNNASIANALAKWERGDYDASYSDAKSEEYWKKLADTYSALELKGYKESLRNEVANYPGLTEKERQEYYDQIDSVVAQDIAGTYYEFIDPSIIQGIEDEDKKRKKALKNSLFNAEAVKKGKNLLNKELSVAVRKKVANDKSITKMIDNGVKSVGKSLKSIGSNVMKSVTSSVSNVTKKVSSFFKK